MPWFRVDDDLALHPKAIAAGNTALGLWVRAGAYSAQYLTDGFVPVSMIATLGGRPRDARALVDARLWSQVAGGYQFHDWAIYQPSRADVEADRAGARERMRKVRQAKREAAGAADVRANIERSSDNPGPARPGPAQNYLLTLVSRLAAGDARDDGPPPAEVIASWQDVAGSGVDLEAEAAAYLARNGDRPARDERGAWLGWLRAARRRQAADDQQDRQAAGRPLHVPCPDHPDQPAGRCRDCEALAKPPPESFRRNRKPREAS